MYTKDPIKQANNNTIHNDFQRVKEKARETRDALSQTANDMKDKAHDLWIQSIKDAKDKSVDLQENVVTYVKQHPVKAVGLALFAGLILSKLLKK
jgi:ElaB/YqjD/DUF883 family membrane-anchored ribosome-binding protein